MIDVHCHLTYPGLDEIKEQVIEDSRKKMDAIITCAFPDDWERALELAKKHENFVYLTLGLHPTDVVNMSDKDIENYTDIIRDNRNRIVAIGEIGLDNHHFPENLHKKRLTDAFVKSLNLCEELGLPAVLHTRKAEEECFDIVNGEDVGTVVFHSYTGNLALAEKIIDRGYYISVPTIVSVSKNIKKIAEKFPLENLLTETDAPFHSPYPEKMNVPSNVEHVLSVMSQLRNVEIDEIDKQIMKNAKKIFRI